MRELSPSQCSLLTCCQLLMYVMYMGVLKIHSHLWGNRWLVQIQHHTSHTFSICAAVWNVSEHREMRIGAILEDGNAREETEKWSDLFVWINLPFTELLWCCACFLFFLSSFAASFIAVFQTCRQQKNHGQWNGRLQLCISIPVTQLLSNVSWECYNEYLTLIGSVPVCLTLQKFNRSILHVLHW